VRWQAGRKLCVGWVRHRRATRVWRRRATRDADFFGRRATHVAVVTAVRACVRACVVRAPPCFPLALAHSHTIARARPARPLALHLQYVVPATSATAARLTSPGVVLLRDSSPGTPDPAARAIAPPLGAVGGEDAGGPEATPPEPFVWTVGQYMA